MTEEIMVYGYVRVSTDSQTVENQRFEIERFCSANKMVIDRWIEETISGTQLPEKRLLGSLLAGAKTGDLIVCSELSRLGRSLFMIMSILNFLLINGVKIWTIKDNYRLGDDIQAKILAFGFGLSAEIERGLISQRTKEALARKKSEGIVLGRPKGSKTAMKNFQSMMRKYGLYWAKKSPKPLLPKGSACAERRCIHT
jgi:DNA invertase Pin-like site-specific DNA recombinase